MSPVVLPGFTAAMPRMQRLVGDVDQPLGPARDVADRVHAAGVAVPAVDDQRHVDVDDVALAQRLRRRECRGRRRG